ncbi:MAG: DUF2634 domain-containing protein [Ruminococcaceae bacterium]|nr:DUF2634 domain-containing protein [Oscillospiraceae bacterium]
MLPVRTASLTTVPPSSSYTYKLASPDKMDEYIDGIDALEQAIRLVFATRRYAYPIYSHNYGNEFSKLYGLKGAVFESEAKRLIKEALLTDDRITSVEGFSFSYESDRILVAFTVKSIFGVLSYGDTI